MKRKGTASYGKEYPTSIRCLRCGGGPLEWQHAGWFINGDGRMRPRMLLVDEDGAPHQCKIEFAGLGD